MTSVTDQAPAVPVRSPKRGRAGTAARRRMIWIALGFLSPALIVLGALVAYPVVYSVVRSLFDANGSHFVGLGNYVTVFTDSETFHALKNNLIWVVVAPFACTALGLVFAVLTERIRWQSAFKLIIFMPMAISMLAAGVIFRSFFQEDPNLGAANAMVVAIHDTFTEQIEYSGARPRTDVGLDTDDAGNIAADATVSPGSIEDFPLVGLKQADVPSAADIAKQVTDPGDDTIAGTVWLDVVSGGGGTNGEIGDGKRGLPGITVQAVDASGQVVGSAATSDDGTYSIAGLDASSEYTVRLAASSFAETFTGFSWLGESLINVVVISAYIWIWAGFAMVMIASGLTALDRNLLDAARIDGANEWKVFTRITVPLLAPVLTVVFVTLIVNVLKIFDLVYVIPPTSSLPAANVVAVEMWTVSFGGGSNYGLGSALAVLLLILVIPAMWVNVRRIREERRR